MWLFATGLIVVHATWVLLIVFVTLLASCFLFSFVYFSSHNGTPTRTCITRPKVHPARCRAIPMHCSCTLPCRLCLCCTPNYRHIRKHEKVVTIGNSSDFYLHRYERKDRHIVTPYRETRERTKPGWAAQLCAVIQCKIQPCKGLWTRHARAHALARAHTGARNTRPVEIHVLIRRRCVWNTRQSWSCATGSWKIKWYSRKRNQEKHDPSTVQKKRPQT